MKPVEYTLAYDEMFECIDWFYNLVSPIQSQKDFALMVKDLPESGVLFAKRKGLTTEEAFKKLTRNMKQTLVESFLPELNMKRHIAISAKLGDIVALRNKK